MNHLRPWVYVSPCNGIRICKLRVWHPEEIGRVRSQASNWNHTQVILPHRVSVSLTIKRGFNSIHIIGVLCKFACNATCKKASNIQESGSTWEYVHYRIWLLIIRVFSCSMYSTSSHSGISFFFYKSHFSLWIAYIFSQYNLENAEKEKKLISSYSQQLGNHC